MSRPSIHTLGIVLVAALVLLAAGAAQAGRIPSAAALLNPDGSVSSPALIGSAYSGPVAIDEYAITLDPALGPVFHRAHSSVPMQAVTGSPRVLAAALFDNMLVLAGSFDPVAGTRSCNIVAWDGAQWVSLGRFGTNGTVFELSVFHDRLIVAGDFSSAGNDMIFHIASWDGEYFSPMSRGLEAPVFALAVHQNLLIAAGLNGLGSTYGMGCSGVIAWDGHRWSCHGYMIQGIVRDVESTGDRLAATGQFFGLPIGRPDTTLYFDGNRWGATSNTHAGIASLGAAADAAK